jgi:hypothetical protein
MPFFVMCVVRAGYYLVRIPVLRLDLGGLVYTLIQKSKQWEYSFLLKEKTQWHQQESNSRPPGWHSATLLYPHHSASQFNFVCFVFASVVNHLTTISFCSDNQKEDSSSYEDNDPNVSIIFIGL